jgi:hypothetical protein
MSDLKNSGVKPNFDSFELTYKDSLLTVFIERGKQFEMQQRQILLSNKMMIFSRRFWTPAWSFCSSVFVLWGFGIPEKDVVRMADWAFQTSGSRSRACLVAVNG